MSNIETLIKMMPIAGQKLIINKDQMDDDEDNHISKKNDSEPPQINSLNEWLKLQIWPCSNSHKLIEAIIYHEKFK